MQLTLKINSPYSSISFRPQISFFHFSYTRNRVEEIIKGQKIDLGLFDRLVSINQGQGGVFIINENSVIRFRDRVCVSYVAELKKNILKEGHRSGLSIDHGATKMYQDLWKLFWWP